MMVIDDISGANALVGMRASYANLELVLARLPCDCFLDIYCNYLPT